MKSMETEYKKLGMKGLNDLLRFINEEHLTGVSKLKRLAEERIKGLKERRYPHKYVYRYNYNKKILKYYNKYQSERLKTDIKFRLNRNVSRLIRKALKGNKAGRKWGSLVGYTLNDLIDRLKNTMPAGYTWQDFLQGKLHIDHIIPISAFNFNCPDHIDFKRCWSLENLRLLPAKENMIKHNKLDRPFQPALRI